MTDGKHEICKLYDTIQMKLNLVSYNINMLFSGLTAIVPVVWRTDF